MAQIDEALSDLHLTSLGRLNAVTQILANYKRRIGKQNLQGRSPNAHCSVVRESKGSTGHRPGHDH